MPDNLGNNTVGCTSCNSNNNPGDTGSNGSSDYPYPYCPYNPTPQQWCDDYSCTTCIDPAGNPVQYCGPMN